MFRNSVISKLRRRTSSCILASSIAVATIAVAGVTESSVKAAPVSFGQINATRTVASDGSFNVYENEQISAYVFTQVDSACLGENLQPGDVITLTVQNFTFSNLYFNYVQGVSSTLPDPVPANIQIYGDTTQVQNSTTGTKVFSPKLRVTRNGQLLVETLGTCYVERKGYARIDATSADGYDDLKDVSQYVARVGDTRLSYNAKACVDMDSVAPGDVLTPSYTLTTGGQNVGSSGAAPNYNWSANMAGDWPPSTIPDPEPTRLELRVFGAVGTEIVGGNTYSFSVDIKKGGVSVAISCPAETAPETTAPATTPETTTAPETTTPNPGTGCISNCGGMPPPPPSCTAGAVTSNAPNITFDSNFGTSGVWTLVESGKNIMIQEAIVGNDGKGYVLVNVIPTMSNGPGSDVSRLYRLNTDGSNDSTWGTNGYVEVSGSLNFMTLGSNGSFILSGSTFANNMQTPVLVRLTSTGSLDTTWGNGGTASFPAPPSGSMQMIAGIAAGPSGSMYVNVETSTFGQNGMVSTYSVFNVTITGTVDTNFGTNGSLSVQGRSMRSDSTGALYVWVSDMMTSTSTMRKFDANGSLVGSFGNNGVLALSARINDAKIIGAHMYLLLSESLSGGGMMGPPPSKTTVARHDRTTGVLDANFATAGVSTVFASASADAMRLVPLPDDSFAVLGFSFSMNGSSAFLLLMDSAGAISANLPSTGATFTSGTCVAENLFAGTFTMGGSFFSFGGKYQQSGNVPMGFKFTISGGSAPVTPPPSTPDSSTPDSSTPSSSTPSSSTPDSSTPSSSTPSSSSPNAPSQATTTIPVTTTTPATTTTVPATTTTVPATTTTVPPPALATVQALPAAPTPIVADATISTGEEITVRFGGFTPFEFVQLIVASTPQVIGSGYADAQGVVTLRGNLPSNLASGNHTLAVFAPVSGVGFTQPITVSQPLLPATGSDGQNNLYVIAMLLFVLGLIVRRTSTVITNK